jgi:hypothetical protein
VSPGGATGLGQEEEDMGVWVRLGDLCEQYEFYVWDRDGFQWELEGEQWDGHEYERDEYKYGCHGECKWEWTSKSTWSVSASGTASPGASTIAFTRFSNSSVSTMATTISTGSGTANWRNGGRAGSAVAMTSLLLMLMAGLGWEPQEQVHLEGRRIPMRVQTFRRALRVSFRFLKLLILSLIVVLFL